MATPLITEFLKKGHELVIVTLDETISSPAIFYGDRITVFVGKYRKYGKIRAFTRFSLEIKQMYDFLKDNPCDIYSAHWSYEFALAALRLDADKTVITLRDNPYKVYELLHDYYRKKRLEMSEKVFSEGKNFVAVSGFIAESLGEKIDNNIVVIPNAIRNIWNNVQNKKLNKKTPVIITVNQGFSELKNTQNTIKAFQKIVNEIPTAQLHMYGREFESGGKAEKWTSEHHCLNGIYFEGERTSEQLVEIFKTADLLIHASYEESFGNVLVEAMACKTVVIGGKYSGAVPWVLSNGKNGILVDISSPEKIGDAAIRILQDEKLWHKYMEQAYKDVFERFSIEKIADQYLILFKEIVKNIV